MILFTFRRKVVEQYHGPYKITGFRSIVELDLDRRGLDLSVSDQCKLDGQESWGRAYGYRSLFVELNPRLWMWGRFHAYYDGPHDLFALGPLKFCWQGDWCQRCYDGDDDE